MKAKYQKYKNEKGEYFYELTLNDGHGTKHMVSKELGDYIHKLETQNETNANKNL